MPKLAAKDRKKVEKAEALGDGDFPLIPPGKYIAELTGVEARTSAAGNPMWVAEFSEITGPDGETFPGRQWYNLNLPTTPTPPDGYVPKGREKDPVKAWESYQNMCSGRIKGFFEAFGYSADSDTDEMIGERCVITIGERVINQGPKAGQKANQVNGVAALDSVPWADGIEVGGGDEDEF